ncbi:MAG TPA: hypothetical protein PLZ57_12725 [Pseudobdellovibrionaceae bacterium]|nr:hypothetical protein [Pseudobdellovibrionaceae bacterium]
MSRVDRQMLVLLLVGGAVLWGARELVHRAADDAQSGRSKSVQPANASTSAAATQDADQIDEASAINFARIDQLIGQMTASGSQATESGASVASDDAMDEKVNDIDVRDAASASRQAMLRLKNLRQCEVTMSESRTALRTGCPRPARNDDPRAEYDALIDGMVAALYDLRGEARAAISRGETPEIDPLAVGQAFARHPNDDVRVAALQILADLPASPAALEAAQHVVKVSNSGEAVLVALDLLKRGQELAPQQITETLLSALERGGFQVRDTVARELLPFLNSDNLASFQRVLGQAPPRSRLAQYLKQNIEERQRDLAL